MNQKSLKILKLVILMIISQKLDRDFDILKNETIKNALDSGIDLREYANQIERELLIVEKEHLMDYVSQSDTFIKLHKDIQVNRVKYL